MITYCGRKFVALIPSSIKIRVGQLEVDVMLCFGRIFGGARSKPLLQEITANLPGNLENFRACDAINSAGEWNLPLNRNFVSQEIIH